MDYLRSRGRTVLGVECLLKFSLWVLVVSYSSFAGFIFLHIIINHPEQPSVFIYSLSFYLSPSLSVMCVRRWSTSRPIILCTGTSQHGMFWYPMTISLKWATSVWPRKRRPRRTRPSCLLNGRHPRHFERRLHIKKIKKKSKSSLVFNTVFSHF